MTHVFRTLVASAVVLTGSVVVAIAPSPGGGGANAPAPVSPAHLGSLPLAFIQNPGQGSVAYSLRGPEASVDFSSHGVALAVRPGGSETAELGMRFADARAVRPLGEGRLSASATTISGDDRGTSATFEQVRYDDLWPGIDAVYDGTSSRLKYRFSLDPGADPRDVRLEWDGARGLTVNDREQLEITTHTGTIVDDTPFTYQVVDGERVEVPSSYRLHPDGTVGFRVAGYDSSRSLVIDPALLINAGYIGGNGSDEARGVAVDAAGNTYVTGETLSGGTTFPDGDGFGAVSGFDTSHNGATDAFVVKINAAGTALVYATFIGGSGFDYGRGVAVDGSGAAYVTGGTASDSTTFPDGDGFGVVPGFDQTLNSNDDAFVVKLNPAGTALEYATYIGGSAFDRAQDVSVDPSGAVSITGRTDSDQTTFPDGDGFGGVPGFDTSHNGATDAFVVKLNPSGTGLSYATYLGGISGDFAFSLVLDAAGSAYVAGFTQSDETTFPDGDGFGGVPGVDQSQNGNEDAFAAKLSPAGTSLSYATFIGGASSDYGFGIGIDPSGNANLGGATSSDQTTFPDGDGFGSVPGSDQTHNNNLDGFLVGLNAAGTALRYATYVGGGNSDTAFGVATDPSGSTYLVGETTSDETTFPDGNGFGGMPGPDQTWNGGYDAFITKVDSSGTLVYAGYLGGSVQDNAYHVAVDRARNAHIVGRTDSDQTEFPDGDGFGGLPSFDATQNGGTDAFAATIEAFPAFPCFGKPATIVGTDGNDTLTGTTGADVIASLGGNDVVKSLGGNDLVCAGLGNDKVSGGGGKDKIKGEKGNDKLNGQGGNDKVKGQAGKDKVKGGGGKDLVSGGGGKDTCSGGGGTDKAPACETEKGIP